MICDVIRSCYESKVRPFTDSDEEYVIRWYPAPDGAKIMPDHHLYASSNWVRDKTDRDIGPGEVTQYQKKFLTGRNPPCYLGQCRVGSDEAWQKGLSIGALDEPAEDLPECCSVLPCPFVGLSILGATTFLYYNLPPPPVVHGFEFCFENVLNNTCLDCSNLNKCFRLAPIEGTPHEWRTETFTLCGVSGLQWHLYKTVFNNWNLDWGTFAPQYAVSNSPPWDEVGPLTLNVTSSLTSCRNWPATITLTPVLI